MADIELGIIVNGATGRIASTQHLTNALVPIRDQGGLMVGDKRVVLKLLLLGRNAEKLSGIAKTHGIADFTTDFDAALARPDMHIFFDAAATHARVATLEKAIVAGKHIYTEKPVAPSVAAGQQLLNAIKKRGLKAGAVEDKIFLPGLQKLAMLVRSGFFGTVTGFRLEFGWWVFDGIERAANRPSWNYKKTGGGGMTSDMYPHWRYVIETLLGPIAAVTHSARTALAERADEQGVGFAPDVDDSATTLVELASGATGVIVSTWAARIRRDDILTLQIDGTGGSALAGIHKCWMQPAPATPTVRHMNPMTDIGADYRSDWQEVPAASPVVNGYRACWERFLAHVVADTALPNNLAAGIRDVALAEACARSMAERRWISFDDTPAR
ncbi:MAG: Gfo/Idh/MocA family protein [Pseudolabrys sp.]